MENNKETPTPRSAEEIKLRQAFKNNSDCYADADDVIQAMTEDAVVNLFAEHTAALQDELDKLKSELKSTENALNAMTDLKNAYRNENAQLEAENKRLRERIDKAVRFYECEGAIEDTPIIMYRILTREQLTTNQQEGEGNG